jgi:hypothetical protein
MVHLGKTERSLRCDSSIVVTEKFHCLQEYSSIKVFKSDGVSCVQGKNSSYCTLNFSVNLRIVLENEYMYRALTTCAPVTQVQTIIISCLHYCLKLQHHFISFHDFCGSETWEGHTWIVWLEMSHAGIVRWMGLEHRGDEALLSSCSFRPP